MWRVPGTRGSVRQDRVRFPRFDLIDHQQLHRHRSGVGAEMPDVQRFDDKVYCLHLDVMTTLAQMLAKECKDGHCEVCHATCVKPALFDVSLSAAELRGASLQQYLKTLDMLGIPGEVTLSWVTQLPV